MLHPYGLHATQVRVPKEETGMVSDLRYGWKKLRKKGIEVSDKLAEMQVGFKKDLVKEVAAFVQDAQAFRKDWETNGPMVPGLDPMEAVDRLKKFQQMFEVSLRLICHSVQSSLDCIPEEEDCSRRVSGRCCMRLIE
jgi:hypothetical protein